MQEPILPTEDATQNPDAWTKYWQDVELYEMWQKNERQKEYRKNYYAEVTKKRQIKKMHELMDQYPDAAKAHKYA